MCMEQLTGFFRVAALFRPRDPLRGTVPGQSFSYRTDLVQ